MIKIERVSKESINSCNDLPHFMYSKEEYDLRINESYMPDWDPILKHLMRTPFEWKYIFTRDELIDLADAAKVSCLTNERSNLHKDELKSIENRLEKEWIDGEWFIKFPSASPKDSKYPYKVNSPEQVIDSLITSKRLTRNCYVNSENVLYFAKYDPNWVHDNEWRIFIKNGCIQAISQYHWHSIANWNATINDTILIEFCRKVDEFSKKILQLYPINDVVIDIYCDPNESNIQLIELNNYLCSGACLFSWKNDVDVFMKEHDEIILRILDIEK